MAQIGLSFVLLVSAGLLLKSFRQLLRTNLGFDPSGVTSVTMRLPGSRYARDRDRTIAFTSSVEERVRALPGVQRAATMFPAMYVNDVNSDNFLVEGHAPPSGTGSEGQTVQYSVTPGLFSTLDIPFRAGRDFATADNASSAPVVIVDDALARRYWAAGDALGKRIRMTGDTTWLTIVGVVGSIRDESVAGDPRPHTYFPYAQAGGSRPTIVVRTAGESAPMVANIRRAVNEIDAGVALDNVHPIAAAISRSLEDRRIIMLLLAGFAALAVLLAGIGLYGMMALYVANRYREFGVRLAIGAKPADLLRLVLREGVALGGIGVTLGAAGGFIATRWVRALLYNVSPDDPLVFAFLATLLLLVVLVACYIPARRAARSDPLVVLRAD